MAEQTLSLVYAEIASRLAFDGVPVRVIARALLLPSEMVRESLEVAKADGTITEIPRDDWPATARRADRLPSSVAKESEAQLLLSCAKIFNLTRLQSNFMLVLLKNNEVSKDTLHHVIEQQRAIRRNRPDNPDQTDPKMVDVVIWNIRKRLKAQNITIITLWGHGYYIPEPDRARANAMMVGATAAPVNGHTTSQ
jgi:hypothetical protein